MTPVIDHGMPRLALLNLAAAALHVAAAVALLTLGQGRAVLAPVHLTIGGIPSPPFAVVDVAATAAVVALIAAAARLAALHPAVRARYERGLRASRHGIRWIEYSQTAGITVFLVAQVNGIAEAGALILIYAVGAGSVLLLALHDRSTELGARGLLAFSAGAAIAIVPWGVVALYQVVGLVAGPQPVFFVQVGTIVFLVIAVAHWASVWLDHQGRGPWASPLTAERVHIGLTLATSAVFVVLVVLAPV
ncbi:MAG: hypothetical protein Q7J04_05745, partial [Microcella sp.]|nr:hypothetical protein [Microcella sp.]